MRGGRAARGGRALCFLFFVVCAGGVSCSRLSPPSRSFDDTNPDKENDVYIASITENVAWLGWRPVATTHSSDYFDELYACANRLIAAGKAYVCFQRKEEVEASRQIARARRPRPVLAVARPAAGSTRGRPRCA